MNLIPSHASIKINANVYLENLPVTSIDYENKTVTVLFEGFSEPVKHTYSLSNVKSFTYPTCVNEIA